MTDYLILLIALVLTKFNVMQVIMVLLAVCAIYQIGTYQYVKEISERSTKGQS